MHKSLRRYLFALLFASIAAYPCLAEDPPPAQPRKLLVENGELVKYGAYKGGERYQDVNIVSWYAPDGKSIKVYVGKHFIGSNIPMPKDYNDYQRQFVISLETASMVRSFGDYTKEFSRPEFVDRRDSLRHDRRSGSRTSPSTSRRYGTATTSAP